MTSLRTMKLLLLLVLLDLVQAQETDVCDTSITNRPPLDSDITVVCGTEKMELSIIMCPIYHSAFTHQDMVLNQQFENTECFGTPDFTVDPPVLKFEIPINPDNSFCGSSYEISNDVGSGDFSDLSNVQFINVSGQIGSIDSSIGTITYRSGLQYLFSCFYPMQYLLKDQRLNVSGVDLAIQDNNGSFISTLTMELFNDDAYTQPLFIPTSGLSLKTKIYVSVKATALTERFNVLLDRCFATANPYPDETVSYDLFVGCDKEPQTTIELNGKAQEARYTFEAFRFVIHNELAISSFYLHCVTRLCEVGTCENLLPCTVERRRRRDTDNKLLPNGTVSSDQIRVKKDERTPSTFSAQAASPEASNHYSSPVVAVIICLVVLSILLVAMAVYFGFYIRRRH
ncbi:zona pellucida-like domain-containing protein 1 [Cynoglossus semilaevis]|uniref:zona pellucida-like domain-containing protein 1 n=1 Tax=Cynoglossus semilaevis TaxID=244447 RepID=UPI000497C659|nr:zona pellucida-like domain-containing protein 1 [Cynoglossus semilaevis]XP_016887513.1 zona pellucida-like domain-containing protein 1 [Cynoglossus semilaevis]XP_016887514.1 zona pellucida-like domain-containing protein 1 [Cynoglossus semilaevis]